MTCLRREKKKRDAACPNSDSSITLVRRDSEGQGGAKEGTGHRVGKGQALMKAAISAVMLDLRPKSHCPLGVCVCVREGNQRCHLG